ncbi:uncharacterized protein [Choristoneura fumiferana]|uniref:uncharacterized protein n=1 Tax=Choristoneura fumiferana TaxID=7141 RepID=UPI003D154D38
MKAVPTSKSSTGKYIPAKGKLVDKVRNLLYISEAKRRTKLTTKYENEILDNENAEGNENLPDTTDDAIWLQNNTDPWEEVLKRWDKTFPERQKSQCSTVHQYLEKWPILKLQKGHLLINLDFEKLYTQQSLNFYKNWQSFFGKLLKLKEPEVSNENALEILQILNAVTENDKKIPLQMTLFGYLVPPKGRLSRKIKFSSSEAIQGLIVQTHDAGDIDNVIQKQNQKASSVNLTVQPYILVVGKLHDFSAIYIVIDDVKYEFQSAAKAFDVLFKIYHVFHAKYPPASSHLYLIIQRKMYEITTRYDDIPPHIVGILNL